MITGGLSKAVEDARTSSQPASPDVQDRRQAGQGAGLSLCWLLRPEGEISIQQRTSGPESKAASARGPALGGCDGNAHHR